MVNKLQLNTTGFYSSGGVRAAVERLAKDNNFEFRASGHVAGFTAILKLFVLAKNYGKVSGTLPSGHKFELYFIDVTTSHYLNLGKRSVRVMQVDIPYYTPQIIINAGDSTALPIEFARRNRYELEGDIPDFFNIYTAPGQEVSALTALAPNIIADMLSYGQVCDIEIYGGSMIFYWDGHGLKEKDIETCFAQTASLVQLVEPGLRAIDLAPSGMAVDPTIKLKLHHSTAPVLGFGLLLVVFWIAGVDASELLTPGGVVLLAIALGIPSFYFVRDMIFRLKARRRKQAVRLAIKKYSG